MDKDFLFQKWANILTQPYTQEEEKHFNGHTDFLSLFLSMYISGIRIH